MYKDSGMYNKGVYRKGFPREVEARYKINSEGWNANREYSESKSGKKRIAIIGDSFVEALQVDADKSLAEVLENDLVRNTKDIEVYRFGVSGAALSQYLQMMRYVKSKYKPDIVVVIVVDNDFLESIYGFGNSEGDFMQFDKRNSAWIEIPPMPYAYRPDPRKMFLKRSAIVRYFSLNLGLKERFFILNQKFRHKVVEGNINTDEAMNNLETIRSLCAHILSKYKETLGNDTKLLLVMDANRIAISAGRDPKAMRLYALNKIVENFGESPFPEHEYESFLFFLYSRYKDKKVIKNLFYSAGKEKMKYLIALRIEKKSKWQIKESIDKTLSYG